MSASKKLLAVALLGLCGLASAQTIDELTDLNRQAMLADARAKLDKKKDGPATPGATAGQAMQPGPALPAAPVITSSVVRRSAPGKKVEQAAPLPILVAIYGVGGGLVTELADSGFEGKYREGDRTPSGWTVSRIEKRLVAVTRPQKGAGLRTALLPFGVKLDEPREKEKDVVVTAAGGLSMPPLPPNFQMLTK